MTLFRPPSFSLRSDEAPMICRMIFDELCVLANGDIVCSCGDPAGIRVFGNVRRDRIADVYNGRLYRKARRRQLAAQPDSYCPVIKTFCGGRVSRASTNGLSLDASKIAALANENLVDRIVFSIDGAREESYRTYRVRGTLKKALGALEALVAARELAGTRDRLEIHWQYILFEWNDSDQEIGEARARAKDIGVPLKWVFTHTAGASRREPGST